MEDGIYYKTDDHESKKVKIEKGKVYYENDKGEFVLTPLSPESQAVMSDDEASDLVNQIRDIQV